MKELIMELFRSTDSEIAAIIHDNQANPDFAEKENIKQTAIATVIARAAIINDITEAGHHFTVEIPGEEPQIDAIDLRTHPIGEDISSKALALDVEDNIAYFQATATSALAIYPEEPIDLIINSQPAADSAVQ